MLRNVVGFRYVPDRFTWQVGQRENGEKAWRDVSARRYFYVKRSEWKTRGKLPGDWKVEEGTRYVRVTPKCSSAEWWSCVERCRKAGVTPYEADLNTEDRWLADHAVEFGNPKILWYDIETDDEGPGFGENIGKRRVVSVAWEDSDGADGFLCLNRLTDEAEARLLEKFAGVLEAHDVAVAWNGAGFDEPVLKERCRLNFHGDDYSRTGIRWLDHMLIFKKYYQHGAEVKQSFSLENVARVVLGSGKLPRGRGTMDMYRNDRAALEAYNRRDVRIMVDLERKTGFVAAARVLANVCNRFLETRSLLAGPLTDSFVLREAAKRGLHFPTKEKSNRGKDDEGQFEGAFVAEPAVGMHDAVHVFDFKSLYPSIIRTFNVSPETYLPKGKGDALVAANGATFLREPEGIFPWAERIAAEKRAECAAAGEKQAADAWKVLSNSIYGQTGAPFSRYYRREMAEAITLSGKKLITEIISRAEGVGARVILSDTDSVAVTDNWEALRDAAFVDAAVKSALGVENKFFVLKYERQFRRVVVEAKKRYAGIDDATGELVVKGLEFVRGDQVRAAREMQVEVVKMVLGGKPDADVAARIEAEKEKCFGGAYRGEDVAIWQGVSRERKDYKGDLCHVRVAEMMRADGREVYLGMKVGYVVVASDPKLDAIPLYDFSGEYDAAYYWGRVFAPTGRVLEAVGGEWPGRVREMERCPDNELSLFANRKKVEWKPVRVVVELGRGDPMDAVRKVIEAHPGSLPVAVIIEGEGEVETGMTSSGGAEMLRGVNRALWRLAARVDRERVP